MAEVRISVIVTVFRRTDFLATALDSVFAQRHQPHEVIVADDSDSRAIEAICRRYPAATLRYTPRRTTQGVALNVATAIIDATGDYIAILNDDDVWEPDFLGEAAEVIGRDPSIDLFFSDHWLIDQKGEQLGERTEQNTRLYQRDRLPAGLVTNLAELVLVYNGVPMAMAAVFRKDALPAGILRGEAGGAYDLWLSAQFAAIGGRAWYSPRRLTHYRVHEAMATAAASRSKYEEHIAIFSELLADKRLATWQDVVRKHLASHLRKAAVVRWRHGDSAKAVAHSREAWKTERGLKSALLRVALLLRVPSRLLDRLITA